MGLRIISPLLSQQTSLITGLKVLVDHDTFPEAKAMEAALLGNALVQGRIGTGEWGAVSDTSDSVRFSTDGGVTWSQPFIIPTGAGIVALLSALTGEDRLSINALKDVASGIEFPTEFDYIQFNTLATHVFNTGKIYWDNVNKIIAMDTEYSGVSLKLGNPYVLVKNNTPYTILKGRAVYMTTPDTGIPTVELGSSSALATCSNLGVTIMNIPSGGTGLITKFGVIEGLDTSAFVAGDFLYLNTANGTFVNVLPVYPEYAIKLGMVLTSNLSTGKILVDVGLDYGSEVIKQIETLGTGNAVTSVVKTGDKLTFNKDETFATVTDLDDYVLKEPGKELMPSDLLNLLKPYVYTIDLPAASTVTGRLSGILSQPAGWILDVDTNPIDLKITHNLDRDVVSVNIYSVSNINGTSKRLQLGNAAYSGIFAPDRNTLRIEALATIETEILIHILFA